MKKFLWMTAAVFATAMVMVACSNPGSSSSGTVDPNLGCGQGASFYNGNCVGANGIVVSTGLAFNANNFSGRSSVSITNTAVFRQFLKEGMMLCDLAYYGNAGASSCDSYSGGSPISISIQTTGVSASSARVTIQVAQYPQYFNFSWGTYPTAGVTYNPLPLNMPVSLINNSRGITIRNYGAQGTYSYRKLIDFTASNQTLTSNYLDYQLSYDGAVFATGRMVVCSDASCSSL